LNGRTIIAARKDEEFIIAVRKKRLAAREIKLEVGGGGGALSSENHMEEEAGVIEGFNGLPRGLEGGTFISRDGDGGGRRQSRVFNSCRWELKKWTTEQDFGPERETLEKRGEKS